MKLYQSFKKGFLSDLIGAVNLWGNLWSNLWDNLKIFCSLWHEILFILVILNPIIKIWILECYCYIKFWVYVIKMRTKQF